MEEKKSSIYEILAANSKFKKPEKEKIHQAYYVVSWIFLFLINSSILWICWNYALVPVMHVSHASFTQSILLYSLAKVISRGFVSPQ